LLAISATNSSIDWSSTRPHHARDSSIKMDTIVPFDNVVDCLRNPPSVHPRPDFAKLRALCLHLTKALKFFECPQSALHGWSGLVMALAVYALLEPVPFFVPTDPGAAPVYTPFTTPAAIKMIDATFERDKNYFKSFKNIYRACFCMLDELVPNQFKVSNSPALLGWNPTMSIELISTQMESSYGKPSAAMLFANDTLFKSPLAANDSPESLFYRMKQCQEIMTLGNIAYTHEQVIANAVRIFMAARLFPTWEFETWDAVTLKTYPALKTFFHKAYNRKLNSLDLQTTSSALSYAPTHNMYNVLGIKDEDSNTVGSTATQYATAAAGVATTTCSTLGDTFAASGIHPGLIAAINQSIAPAFNQVVQNQNVLQHQIAAMSLNQTPPLQAPPAYVQPPVQQVAFPMPQSYQPRMQQQPSHQTSAYGWGQQNFYHGGRGGGRGSRWGGRRQGEGSRGRQRRPAFATMVWNQEAGGIFAAPNQFGGPGPFAPMVPTQMGNAPSPIKRYANWNACFSCGFDVEDGHTSATCPMEWCKPNHQVGYTRANAATYAACSFHGRHSHLCDGQGWRTL
jgi:hypothetical protein